jgi:hypothetical protein
MEQGSLWNDYVSFHTEQIKSWDIDPVYPVLKYINKDVDAESAIWLTFLHVAYYHIGSALAVWHEYPYPAIPSDDMLKLPCGTERRAHRDPAKLKKHLTDLITREPLSEFVNRAITNDPRRSWARMELMLQTIWGNGRWATFKTSEMLMKVNDLALEATDMGHKNGSGSKHGLKLLFPNAPMGNSKRDIAILDKISEELVERLREVGAPATLETAETSLCDFHSMLEGRYYVGYDIDAMMKQLRDVPSPLTEKAFEARRATIPMNYLGEINGWETTDDERKRAYKQQRAVLFR